MDRRFSVRVFDIEGKLVITKFVDREFLDDFIMSIPNRYDAGDIEINNIWFYVDELKDLVMTKPFTR